MKKILKPYNNSDTHPTITKWKIKIQIPFCGDQRTITKVDIRCVFLLLRGFKCIEFKIETHIGHLLQTK